METVRIFARFFFTFWKKIYEVYEVSFIFWIFSSQGQKLGRLSKRLAGKAEEEGEEVEMKEEDGGQKDSSSPIVCDPSLTEAEATSIRSSKFYTACMYHSLLIHIQIIQQFSLHARCASFGITEILSYLNHGATLHNHTQACTHFNTSIWDDW